MRSAADRRRRLPARGPLGRLSASLAGGAASDDWIESERCGARELVWIAGNHDFALELGGPGPRLSALATYLQDSETTVGGLRIYGTPWTEWIGPWAFSLAESGGGANPASRPDLETVFAAVPEGIDVLISHSPPYGLLDRVSRGDHVGSFSLLRRLREVRPRLAVFGHIHEAFGSEPLPATRPATGEHIAGPETTLANVSLLDELYSVAHQPVSFELSGDPSD